MPFKLKLRKNRHSYVLTRNVFVVTVELLDANTLECTLSAESTGFDCLHNVCHRLGLRQSEFFGLRYMSKRPYPKVRWVELERPLKKQLDKYAQSPILSLAVLYYVHDVRQLHDDVSRTQYFLQVKKDVLEGKLRCNQEQAVLLASYSLQAEFGDHQEDRHTTEYLQKGFRLFPKQVVSDGDVGVLLDAVVHQYSSLQGLAQPLAETYYIIEAQYLDGYGQETFIARDERGCEVYLGASLMGIVVRPASGHSQTFYRWNDIPNLFISKRTLGIECQRPEEKVHFTFEEPDAAKYVWKMCVKQHTFYKRNQEFLEGGSNLSDVRSLTMPDLQRSVLHHSHSLPCHDTINHRVGVGGDISVRSSLEAVPAPPYSSPMPTYEVSFVSPKHSVEAATLEAAAHVVCDHSYNLLSPVLQSSVPSHSTPQVTYSNACYGQTQTDIPQPLTAQALQLNEQAVHEDHCSQQLLKHQREILNSQQLIAYSSNQSLPSMRSSIRNQNYVKLLPKYRSAPDYETAIMQKYGPRVNPASVRAAILYSSQPDISTKHHIDPNQHPHVISYSHYKNFADLSSACQEHSQFGKGTATFIPGVLHSTYSTPELASVPPESADKLKGGLGTSVEFHCLHGLKPPPSYPYHKPSSNSTPDLASLDQNQQGSPDLSSQRRALLTASLGRLGSPELSRTYENLADLGDAVESLRNELSRTTERNNILHSYTHNISRDDLDAVYQLSNGHVAVGRNINFAPVYASEHIHPYQSNTDQNQIINTQQLAKSSGNCLSYGQDRSGNVVQNEPVYQNIVALLEDSRECTNSAPELNSVILGGLNTIAQQQNKNIAYQSAVIENAASCGHTVNHQPVSFIDQANISGNLSLLQVPVFAAVHQDIRNQQNINYLKHQLPYHQKQVYKFSHGPVAISDEQHGPQCQMQVKQYPISGTCQYTQPPQTQVVFSHPPQAVQINASAIQSHQHQLPHHSFQVCDQVSAVHSLLHTSHEVPVQFSGIQKEANKLPLKFTPKELPNKNINKGPVSSVERKSTSTSVDLGSKLVTSSPRRKWGLPLNFKQNITLLSPGSIDSSQITGMPESIMEEPKKEEFSNDPRISCLERKLFGDEILAEYESIPRVKATLDVTSATLLENASRNKYKDIIPYEENRVKIIPSKDNKTGYINASHITATVGSNQRFYICAQGPTSTTVVDFWQCIWECDVYLIVMLTSVVGDSHQSFPYWPQTDNTSVECGSFRIFRKHSTLSGSHILSRLQLVNVPLKKSRYIWHLQYTDWADHGCPEDTGGFIAFLEELSTVRRLTFNDIQGVGRNKNTPVLVHCSAGVGRSGVTILCDLLLEAADYNLPLNVAKRLEHLRQQRMCLVQTISQYKFVYRVLITYLKRSRLI